MQLTPRDGGPGVGPVPPPLRLRLRLRDPRPILALLVALPWWMGSVYFLLLAWPAGGLMPFGGVAVLPLVLAVGATLVGALVHRGVRRGAHPDWRWLGQGEDGAFWLSRAREPVAESRCALRILAATRRVGENVWLVGEVDSASAARDRPAARKRRRERTAFWIDAASLTSAPGAGASGPANVPPSSRAMAFEGCDALRQLRMRLLWPVPDGDEDGAAAFRRGWIGLWIGREPMRSWIERIRDSRVTTGGTGGSVGRPRILGQRWQQQGRAMDAAKNNSEPGEAADQAPDPAGASSASNPARPVPMNGLMNGPKEAYPPEVEALLSADPEHVYSDDELDAIEALDAELALRLDRAQTFAARGAADVPADGPIDVDAVRAAVEEARRILVQDGGDIEFVEMKDRVAVVRLKGACVGCPRSTLDLRNVVERLVRSRAPGVERVANTF